VTALARPPAPTGDGLVLTHGAGTDADAPLLVALAEAFAAVGLAVLRYELPFRRARPTGPPAPASAAADREGLKAKRLRNNPRVTVVPCNNRGKVADGASPVTGTAQLVSGGAEFDEIRSKVKAKYGVMVPISKFFNTLGHIGNGPFPYGDTGVIISVDA